MKISPLVLALAIGVTDAFVSPSSAAMRSSSQLQSTRQPSPFNGGTAGSSNLPGQYGTINVDSPYGGQTQQYQPTGKKPTNEYGRDIGGPVNGGTNGSSNLPGQYDMVSIDDPYGGPRKTLQTRSTTTSKPAVSDYSGGANEGMLRRTGPINGGTNGSSLLPERYETVSIDHPWGAKNPQAPMKYYSPQPPPSSSSSTTETTTESSPTTAATSSKRSASLAARSAAPFASGITGGAEGSSRMVDRGVVGIDTPWGTNQRGA